MNEASQRRHRILKINLLAGTRRRQILEALQRRHQGYGRSPSSHREPINARGLAKIEASKRRQRILTTNLQVGTRSRRIHKLSGPCLQSPSRLWHVPSYCGLRSNGTSLNTSPIELNSLAALSRLRIHVSRGSRRRARLLTRPRPTFLILGLIRRKHSPK